MLKPTRKLIAISTVAAIYLNMLLPRISYAEPVRSNLPIINYEAQIGTHTGIIKGSLANVEDIITYKADKELDVPIIANYQGHTNTITTMAISPDDKYLASGSEDKTVRMYNMQSQNEVTILGTELGEIKKVVFSPAGDKLAYCDTKGNVKIWNVKDKKLIQALKLSEGAVNYVLFSNDGKILYSGDNNGVLMAWDIENFKITDYKEFKSSINALVYNKYNNTLVIGLQNSSIVIMDTEDYSIVKTLKNVITDDSTMGVEHAVMSPDSTYLVLSSSKSKQPVLINLKDEYERISLQEDDFRYKDYNMWDLPTFTSDGNFIIGCDKRNDHIGIFNFYTKKLVKELDIHPTSIALSEDGHCFAVGNLMDEINLYDTSNCKKSQILSITIEKQDNNFVKDQAMKLVTVAHYDDGTDKKLSPQDVEWSVSDKDVAMVTQGLFYAFKAKRVNITASYKGMNYTLLANVSGDKNDSDSINSITYDKSKELYVAVGNSGRIKYSYNKVDWQDAVNGTIYNIKTVVCGNGIFAAIDEADQILTSNDGKIWNVYSISHNLNSIEWDGVKFTVSSGEDFIITSKDGIKWDIKK